MTLFKRVSVMALGGALAVAPLGAAFADDKADAGLVLAKQYCAGCHVVAEGTATDQEATQGPPFSALAKDDGWQGGKLGALLKKPHATMAPIEFTSAQIADLEAYFASFK